MPPADGTMDDFVFPPFVPGGFTPRREPAPAPETAPAETETVPSDVVPALEADVFDAGAEITASEPEPESASYDAGGDSEDLPWLELPPGSREPSAEEAAAPGAAAVADAGAEAGAQAEGAFPDWLAWDARDSDQAEEEIAHEAPAAAAEGLVAGEDLMDVEYAATAVDEDDEPAVAPSAIPPDTAEAWADADVAEPPAGTGLDGALADALAGVADHLERLAATLRDRPGALLSGDSTDPLDLLVAGYALGLAQGRAHGRDG